MALDAEQYRDAVKQVILHKYQFNYGIHLSADIDVQLRQSVIEGAVEAIIRWFVPGSVHKEDHDWATEIWEIPDGWWQMLKQERLPQWLLRWLPVRTRRVTTGYTFLHKEYHLCPHINIPVSQDRAIAWVMEAERESRGPQE